MPAPKRGEIVFRFAALVSRAQAGARRADDARDGQGARRGRGRRPGSDRHELLHGRRGQAPPRPDDAVRAPGQVQHERADADRRRRRDHAVELPDRDSLLEDRARRSSAATRSCSSRRTTRPRSAERFVELLAEAGVPDGRRQRRPRRSAATSATGSSAIPTCRVVTLTGSRETGVAVLKAAADNLKHVHLELGGKNGIIVMEDADLDLAADGILWSAFGTSGQRCTAASRVIVARARLRRARRPGSSPRRSGCGSGRAGSPTPTSAR